MSVSNSHWNTVVFGERSGVGWSGVESLNRLMHCVTRKHINNTDANFTALLFALFQGTFGGHFAFEDCQDEQCKDPLLKGMKEIFQRDSW